MKYGIYLDGLLIEKYETPDEAYESAIASYVSSGEFHEVKSAPSFEEAINETEEKYMFKVIFTLINKDLEEDIVIKYKEGTKKEAEDYAKQEANEYLDDFRELISVGWDIASVVGKGFVSRDA